MITTSEHGSSQVLEDPLFIIAPLSLYTPLNIYLVLAIRERRTPYTRMRYVLRKMSRPHLAPVPF